MAIHCKVIICGGTRVGKTSLINAMMNIKSNTYDPTLGVIIHNIYHIGKKGIIIFDIIDTQDTELSVLDSEIFADANIILHISRDNIKYMYITEILNISKKFRIPLITIDLTHKECEIINLGQNILKVLYDIIIPDSKL